MREQGQVQEEMEKGWSIHADFDFESEWFF